MKKSFVLSLIFLVLTVSFVYANEKKPVAISPGEEVGLALVEQSCPTFSWTSVPWATGYRIAVFETNGQQGIYEDTIAQGNPVLVREIPGAALSWTPSGSRGLTNGVDYIWYVQAVDANGNGVWSSGKLFKVNITVSFDKMLARIKGQLKEYGISEDVLNEVFKEMKPQAQTGGEKADKKGTDYKGMPIVTGNETGSNTYYGDHAGFQISSGINNSFFGYFAGATTTTQSRNSYFGWKAGLYATGNYNCYFGNEAGQHLSNSGSYNVFIGNTAGYSNTTGYRNTFIGEDAGYSNQTGYRNVFIGQDAGFHETGSYKLYIDTSGTSSPLIYGDFNTNIVSINGKLGVGSTSNFTPTVEVDVDGYVKTKYFMQRSEAPQMRWYETDGSDPADFFKMNYHANSLEFIWYDASSATTYIPIKMEGNGYVGINNTSPTHMLDVGTSGAYCNGGAWIDGSSIEYKENIQNVGLDEAIDTLKNLKPIKYNYKEDKEEQYLGFIAEDVPELVAMNERNGLHTMDVVTILTKVVQNQQKEIKTLKEEWQKKDKRKNQLFKTQLEEIESLKTKYKIMGDLIKRIEKLEKK